MSDRYEAGYDYKEHDSSFTTYGIDRVDPVGYDVQHASQIVVYGNQELRDRIVKLLNKYEKKQARKRKGGIA